ncbi:MAG: DNA polymerase IV [Calditrichaeota bacterium]|nr:DNA polymerase IV [Calditrichota bacterium]MCB9368550.1 DNA polymerase IV [Calditrichota bacterium]
MSKTIFHLDLDQFFAAVEMRDNPSLRGKPVLVGGSPGGRGVVTTASYEARKYGVRSGMPMHEALQKCPQAICVRSDSSRYVDASRRVRDILVDYTDKVEFISIDEAALDMTDVVWHWPSVAAVAHEIQRRIEQEVGITASIGAGASRCVAKLASGMHKPRGFTHIPPSKVAEIMGPLPVEEMNGVGPATRHVLNGLGIRTLYELAIYPTDILRNKLGVRGPELQLLARGGGNSTILRADDLPVEKSMSHETTFFENQTSADAILGRILLLSEKVARRMRTARLTGRVVTVKVRYKGFETVHQQKKLARFVHMEADIFIAAKMIFEQIYDPSRPVRLIGVDVSQLVPMGRVLQQELFAPRQDRDSLTHACDDIKDRFGPNLIGYAGNMLGPKDRFHTARRGRQFGSISFRFEGMNGR